MKKNIYIGTVVFAFFSLIYYMNKPENIDATEMAKADLERIQNYYGDAFYTALYSIDELRPFSIIQLDKIFEKNTKGWVSPNEISKDLTQNDKELLKNKISEYISTFEIPKRNNIIYKIKCWCMAERNFSDIIFSGNLSYSDLLAAIKKNSTTSEYFEKKTPRGPGDITTMSDIELKQAYFEAINIVSGLNFSDQLKFYSDIYNHLSKFAAVKIKN